MSDDISTPVGLQEPQKSKPQNVVRFNPSTSQVPLWLKQEHRWVMWQVQPCDKTGRAIKCPLQKSGKRASSNRSAEWCSFDEAVKALNAHPKKFDGIGFVLGDGFGGFDLDYVLNERGEMSDLAYSLLEHLQPFSNAWIETSPSGIGVKAFFRIQSIDGAIGNSLNEIVKNLDGTNFDLPTRNDEYDHIEEAELYSGGRYFTFTGVPWSDVNDLSQEAVPLEAKTFISLHGALDEIKYGMVRSIEERSKKPAPIKNYAEDEAEKPKPKPEPERTAHESLTDEKVIEIATTARNGAKIQRMLKGDASDYGDDASQMHAGLACALQFYCGSSVGGGRDQVERIIYKHLKGTHPKIGGDDEMRNGGRQTYLQLTIDEVIPSVKTYYTPKREKEKKAPKSDVEKANEINEFKLVDAFVKMYQGSLIFVPEEKTWYRRDKSTGIFEADRNGIAFTWVRECIEKYLNQSPDPNAGKHFRIDTVWRVLRASQSHGAFSTLKEELDSEPMVLGTPDGVYDLTNGKRIPRDELTSLVTRKASVSPALIADDSTCPNWLRFVNEACGFNQEKVKFLQRYCGYCLTGDFTEHAFVIIYGQSGTGKGKFTQAIHYVLGEYATIVPATSLMETRSQTAASSDIAKLAGARFALANEFPEGQALDEQRVKALTGGDKMTARFNGQNFFDFKMQAKMIATTNHKPRLKNPNAGLDRRLYLVEFTQAPAKIDQRLSEKFEKEASGILRWAMDGLKELQQNRIEGDGVGGLNAPKVVLDATKNYLEAEDYRAAWLEDCFELKTGAITSTEVCIRSWESWSKSEGINVELHPRMLAELLEAKGCIRYRNKERQRGWQGIQIKDLFYAGLNS